jgi:ParB family protein of integrating conjugative element (PFGI_1 class)
MTDVSRALPRVSPNAAKRELEIRHFEISQIKTYEHNPRRAANAEYDRIKRSIRVDGLSQPLVVTQRPGETDYVVHAGGNTRLRILKELFAETDDPRFGKVACWFRAWTQEADVLLAHLKENDLRGALTFLDKALAVADGKRLLEEETGGDKLSQSRLAELLTERGYSLSQGLISQMTYAVGRLLPLMPQALENGIGRPQVARVRALDRVARALWIERAIDSEAEYDAAFEALCRRYDCLDWDIANLRRAIEAEIAERSDLNLHAVSIELDARLAGRSAIPQDPPWRHQTAVPPSDKIADESDAEAKLSDELPSGPGHQHPRDAKGAPSKTPPVAAWVASEPAPRSSHGEALGDAGVTLGGSAGLDMKSLRARLWTLASGLAQRNGLGDLVQPLPSHGLGFVLRDVPDPALIDQLDEDALAQVSMVWWHLAACAELTVAPLTALLPALPQKSVLRRALVEQDAGLLFASVWTLDPGHTGYRLWRCLEDRDWHDLLGLMDAYRALHRTAAANGECLWEVAS